MTAILNINDNRQEITRATISSIDMDKQVDYDPNVLSDFGRERRYSLELVLTQPAYALSLGPLCTFSELVIFKGGDVSIDGYVYGPPSTFAAVVISARRPWVGILPAGNYRVMAKRSLPHPGTTLLPRPYYRAEQAGERVIATGNGQSVTMTVSGWVPNPVAWMDIIAYHYPVTYETLPKQRNPHVIRTLYQHTNGAPPSNIVMAPIWPIALTKSLYLHTEDRKYVDFHIREDFGASIAKWTVDIYGVTFNESVGPTAEMTTTALFSTGGAVLGVNLWSMELLNAFDAWRFDLTRTVDDFSSLQFHACARD